MEIHIYSSVDEVIEGLANYFVEKVNSVLQKQDKCTVVLSGGNSPKKLYELLASPEYNYKVDWDKLYFFFGDERCVPFTDPENNGGMVKKSLFNPLMIADANIFYINTSLPPDEAAEKYSKRILSFFRNDPVQFDLILLGLGDNGHTASLFPHTAVLHENRAFVKAVHLTDQPSHRISMTAALINEAHSIAFLVYGEAKANAVHEVIEGKKDPETFPARLIVPEEGELHWFLDEAAAGNLSTK